MTECGLSLAGYHGVDLARAYCQEALARPDRLLILLASSGAQVMGFLVVLCAPWTFWRGFLLRHPLLALRMGAGTLGRAHTSSDVVPSLWHSGSPGPPRVLMIAVSPSHRRRGLGGDLYRALFALGGHGYLALVSQENQASLALHRSTGWCLESDGGNPLLATHRMATPGGIHVPASLEALRNLDLKVRDCPDLAAMSDTERADFWSQSDPRELRGLGDRLLAESLPRGHGPNHRKLLSQLLRERRLMGEWSRARLAELLGVTNSMLAAWERDQVRTPDSLPLILDRLVTLQVPPE